MSEHLNVTSTLSAVDRASPVIQKLLANIRKLQAVSAQFNSSFASVGRTGADAMASFDRVTKNAASQMRGLANTSRSAAREYAADWRRVTEQRLSESRRMFAALDRMEAHYQRRSESRQPAHGRGRAGSAGGVGGGRGGLLMFPGNYAMIGGAAVAAGVKGAFTKRMEADSAEVKAKIFGELSKEQIKSDRRKWIDRDAVKYGQSPNKVIDAYTESLKAGFGKDAAKRITEGALQAQSALELDIAPLIKTAAKVATIFGGDIKNVDPARVVKMMNSIAVAAAETAADPSEVIEGYKKGNAALAMSNGKMAEGDLAAILAVAVSGGAVPAKAGNAISNLVSTLIGAGNAKGAEAEHLGVASRMLGFGSRKDLAKQSAASPTETLLKIFKRIDEMSAEDKVKVSRLLGGKDWDDEFLVFSKTWQNMAETIEKTRSKTDLLAKSSAEKLNSLQGKWNSVVAAFVLHFEKIGAGLEDNFRELADWFLEYSATIDGDKLTETVRKLTATIKEKLAPVTGLIDFIGKIFGFVGDVIAKLDQWFGGTVVEEAAKKTQSLAARILPSSMGFPAGKIIADLLIGIVNEIIDSIRLAKRAAGKPGDDGTPKLEKQSFLDTSKEAGKAFRNAAFLGNTAEDYRKYVVPASFTSSPSGSGGGFSYASGGKAVSHNATPLHHAVPGQKLPSFGLGSGGIIKRDKIPNYSGTGGSVADDLSRGAFEKKFAGTPLSGKYDQIVSAAKANGFSPSLLAGIVAHETGNGKVLSGNNPGGIMDPSTGHSKKMRFADLDAGISKTGAVVGKNFRRAGGDLDKMNNIYAPVGAANDPGGLNGGWPAGVRKQMNALSGPSSGSAGTGDAVAYAEKFKGMNEYRDTRVLAAELGGDVRGKSNAWCARFVNRALAVAGGKGTGSAVANSFQKWGSGVADHSAVRRNDVLVQTKGYGPNQTGGHVGFATGKTRMHNGKLQLQMLGGNQNDSVSEQWLDSNRDLMVRRGNIGANVPEGITNAVPPAAAVSNVPADAVSRGLTGPGMMRGGSGAQIHINGGSHDPEALANLVQRRIDESMNYRTHDTASEYS